MAAPRLNSIHQSIDNMKSTLDNILATGKDGAVTLTPEQLEDVQATLDALNAAKGELVCVQGFSVYTEP